MWVQCYVPRMKRPEWYTVAKIGSSPCNGVQVSKSNRIMRQRRFGGLHNLESQFNRVSKSVCSLARVIMLLPLCKAFIGPIRDMHQEVLSRL
jgi:hypothetical protein